MAIPRVGGVGDGNWGVNGDKVAEKKPIARSQTIDEFVEEYNAALALSEETSKRVEEKKDLLFSAVENLVDEVQKLFVAYTKTSRDDYPFLYNRFTLFKKQRTTMLCSQKIMLIDGWDCRNIISSDRYYGIFNQLLKRNSDKYRGKASDPKSWEPVKRDIAYAVKNGSSKEAEKHYTRLIKVRGDIISLIEYKKEKMKKKDKRDEEEIDKKLEIANIDTKKYQDTGLRG